MFEHDFEAFPELTNAQLEVLRLVSPHEQIERDFFATVVKVHDGDTVTLRTDFRSFDFPLRLLDVDAPELSEDGAVARDWLKARLEGQEVQILVNPVNRVGKYGRLLGYVFHNGMNLSDEMLYLGLVKPFGSKHEGEPLPLDKILKEAAV